MKTYKILGSKNEIYTFTVNDKMYTLYMDTDEGHLTLLQAVDTGNGLEFTESLPSEMDYSDLDNMRLFLNLLGRVDYRMYDTYIITEPIGQI